MADIILHSSLYRFRFRKDPADTEFFIIIEERIFGKAHYSRIILPPSPKVFRDSAHAPIHGLKGAAAGPKPPTSLEALKVRSIDARGLALLSLFSGRRMGECLDLTWTDMAWTEPAKITKLAAWRPG